MRLAATAILTAGLFLGSYPTLAEQRNPRLQQLEALKRIADLCSETKRCGGLIENVQIDLQGKKIDAVKVTTPEGTKTFFIRNLELGQICYCTDCVSVPPVVWCDVLL